LKFTVSPGAKVVALTLERDRQGAVDDVPAFESFPAAESTKYVVPTAKAGAATSSDAKTATAAALAATNREMMPDREDFFIDSPQIHRR